MNFTKMTQKNKSRKRQNPTVEISCDSRMDEFLNVIEDPLDNAITLQFNPKQRKISTELSDKDYGNNKYIDNLLSDPQTSINFRNYFKDIKNQISTVYGNMKNLNNKFSGQNFLKNINEQKCQQQSKQYGIQHHELTQKKNSRENIKRLPDKYSMIMNENNKFDKDYSKIHEDNDKDPYEENYRVPHKKQKKCKICSKKNYLKSSHVKRHKTSPIKQHKSAHQHHCRKSHNDYHGLWKDYYNTQQSDYHDIEYPTSYQSSPQKHIFLSYEDLTSEQNVAVEHLEKEYYFMIKHLKDVVADKYLKLNLPYYNSYNTSISNTYKEQIHEVSPTSDQEFAQDIGKIIIQSAKPFEVLSQYEIELRKYNEDREKLRQNLVIRKQKYQLNENESDFSIKNNEIMKMVSNCEKLFCELRANIETLKQQVHDVKEQRKENKISSKKDQIKKSENLSNIIISGEYLKDRSDYEKLSYCNKEEVDKLQQQINSSNEENQLMKNMDNFNIKKSDEHLKDLSYYEKLLSRYKKGAKQLLQKIDSYNENAQLENNIIADELLKEFSNLDKLFYELEEDTKKLKEQIDIKKDRLKNETNSKGHRNKKSKKSSISIKDDNHLKNLLDYEKLLSLYTEEEEKLKQELDLSNQEDQLKENKIANEVLKDFSNLGSKSYKPEIDIENAQQQIVDEDDLLKKNKIVSEDDQLKKGDDKAIDIESDEHMRYFSVYDDLFHYEKESEKLQQQMHLNNQEGQLKQKESASENDQLKKSKDGSEDQLKNKNGSEEYQLQKSDIGSIVIENDEYFKDLLYYEKLLHRHKEESEKLIRQIDLCNENDQLKKDDIIVELLKEFLNLDKLFYELKEDTENLQRQIDIKKDRLKKSETDSKEDHLIMDEASPIIIKSDENLKHVSDYEKLLGYYKEEVEYLKQKLDLSNEEDQLKTKEADSIIIKSDDNLKDLLYYENLVLYYKEEAEKLLQQIDICNKSDQLKEDETADELLKAFLNLDKLFYKLEDDTEKLQRQIGIKNDQLKNNKSSSKEDQLINDESSPIITKTDENLKHMSDYEKLLCYFREEVEYLKQKLDLSNQEDQLKKKKSDFIIIKSDDNLKDLSYYENLICYYKEEAGKFQQQMDLCKEENQLKKIETTDELLESFSSFDKTFRKFEDDSEKLQQQINDEKTRLKKSESGSKEEQLNKKNEVSNDLLDAFSHYSKLFHKLEEDIEKLKQQMNDAIDGLKENGAVFKEELITEVQEGANDSNLESNANYGKTSRKMSYRETSNHVDESITRTSNQFQNLVESKISNPRFSSKDIINKSGSAKIMDDKKDLTSDDEKYSTLESITDEEHKSD